MVLSLSEIVNKTTKLKTKEEKVEWLKKNNSLPLRDILTLMFNKNLKFNIPTDAPPYQPSEFPDSHGMLYKETRKLKYFVEGFGDNVHQYRREVLFIQMLESVDKEDAKLLIQMLKKKPPKGLTLDVVNTAFENLIPVATKEKKDDKK